MWWEVVFLLLLLFFILFEFLIGFGIVWFVGVLFEFFMWLIFWVSGVGGFVFVMGMVLGNLVGVKFIVCLW